MAMPIGIDEAVLYRIELQGELDPSWSAEFRGLTIERSRGAGGQVVTTMTGEVADQAALTGVLNLAYALHMPVLSVTCLGRRDTPAAGKS